MKFSLLITAAATAQLVAAHTFVYGIRVNGVDLGRGDGKKGPGDVKNGPHYIRSVRNNDPVKNLMSRDMTCNTPGSPAPSWATVKGGDKVSWRNPYARHKSSRPKKTKHRLVSHHQIDIEWHHNTKIENEVIASSHKGPVQVYIAPAASNGQGNVWVKIASDGYNGNQWAVEKLNRANGIHSFAMPRLEPGDYLLRPEIIALHEGNRDGGAQLYLACVQVKVAGSGGSVSSVFFFILFSACFFGFEQLMSNLQKLPTGVAIPGVYSAGDRGIKYDIYNKDNLKRGYTAPGPAVTRFA
jgi:cellulase